MLNKNLLSEIALCISLDYIYTTKMIQGPYNVKLSKYVELSFLCLLFLEQCITLNSFIFLVLNLYYVNENTLPALNRDRKLNGSSQGNMFMVWTVHCNSRYLAITISVLLPMDVEITVSSPGY